jgi:hypothetical protein
MTTRLFNRFATLGFGLAMALAAGAAQATTTVNVSSAGIDSVGYKSGQISYDPPGTSSDVNESGNIGRIAMSGTNESGLATNWESFCVDIYHYLGTGAFTVQDVSTLGLSATQLGQVKAVLSNADGYIIDSTTSAAVQMALWEIIYENSANNYSLSTGYFQVSGANVSTAITDANNILTNVINGTWLANSALQVSVFAASGKQSQLAYSLSASGASTSVPEPATWVMMLLGFGTVGFSLRRKRPHAMIVR